jgi:hypothetical protein
LIIIALGLLHAGLALSFKIMFFSYYAMPQIGPKDPFPVGGPGDMATTTTGAIGTPTDTATAVATTAAEMLMRAFF